MGGEPGAEPVAEVSAGSGPLPAAPRRTRRPVRILVWLLVVLVVLGAALLTGDRVGHARAQQIVADRIATELVANGVEATTPEVSIGGTPFLTQVVSGRYERVTVNLREAATDALALARVRLTATGVSAELGTLLSQEGTIVADRVAGTARIGYEAAAELADLPGLELSDSDGLLGIRLPRRVPVLDERLFFVGTAELSVRSGVVRLDVQEMEVEEDALLPFAAEIADQYAQDYAEEISLALQIPPLPFDLSIETVSVEPAGLVIAVSAANVPLAR